MKVMYKKENPYYFALAGVFVFLLFLLFVWLEIR